MKMNRYILLLIVLLIVGCDYAPTEHEHDYTPPDGYVFLWGEFYNIENTTDLSLANNQLTVIPSEIGQLTNLFWLKLQENQLSGEIPVEIGDMTRLTHLYLSSNQLTGSIPSEIENLTDLTLLWLSYNQLTTLPESIGNLSSLTELYLHNNQLTGEIPEEICNQGDSTPSLENNQLCPPYPDCGEGPITSEEDQDTSECIDCPDSIEGDVNGDGEVNVLDIVLISYCILSDNCDECSDWNLDGSVDILDIIIMVNLTLYP